MSEWLRADLDEAKALDTHASLLYSDQGSDAPPVVSVAAEYAARASEQEVGQNG